MAISISDKPAKLRVGGPRGGAGQVDREARVIRGFSVITRGEALGHGLWIDEAFLDQTVKAGNKAGAVGVKSRFTHPGLSGDGMGKALGRAKNFTRDGDQVRADLHLLKVASEAPDGDLAGYVMDLAAEDPAAFGASIVFDLDRGEMDRFKAKHTDKDGNFISPDEGNASHYPHARLAKLYAADAVDDPAANPDGFFSFPAGGELAARAEQILSFALGLSDVAPGEIEAGPHPERARAFLADFMQRHGLAIIKPLNEDGDYFPLVYPPQMEGATLCIKGRGEGEADDKERLTLAKVKARAEWDSVILGRHENQIEFLNGRVAELAADLNTLRRMAAIDGGGK